MRRTCPDLATYHEGCPCHEQGWADTANALRRERDDARTDAVDNAHEAAKLRRALTCETCDGEGFVGYHDQQDPCPGCIDVRRELAGGRWHGIGQ